MKLSYIKGKHIIMEYMQVSDYLKHLYFKKTVKFLALNQRYGWGI